MLGLTVRLNEQLWEKTKQAIEVSGEEERGGVKKVIKRRKAVKKVNKYNGAIELATSVTQTLVFSIHKL